MKSSAAAFNSGQSIHSAKAEMPARGLKTKTETNLSATGMTQIANLTEINVVLLKH